MSLRTHTEQRRIEVLEAELAMAHAEITQLSATYTDALAALAAASAWRANAILAALVGGFAAVVWLRWVL